MIKSLTVKVGCATEELVNLQKLRKGDYGFPKLRYISLELVWTWLEWRDERSSLQRMQDWDNFLLNALGYGITFHWDGVVKFVGTLETQDVPDGLTEAVMERII
jgi:hypothetical protein